MAFLGVSFCLRVVRARRPGWLPCLPGLPRKFRACRASLFVPSAGNRRRVPASRPDYAAAAAFLPSFEEARAVYVNTGSLRDLLLAFKYGGAVHLAGSFAQMMAEAVRGNPHWFGGKKRLLVPVPMHRGKQARRGVQPGAGTGGFTGRGTGLAVCRRAETPAGYASPGQLVAGAAAQTCP